MGRSGERNRPGSPAGAPEGPLDRRPGLPRGRALLAFAPLAAALALSLTAASSGTVHVIGEPYRELPLPVPSLSARTVTPPVPGHLTPPDQAPDVLRLLVLVIVLATLVTALVLLWRSRGWRRRRPGAPPLPPPGVAETVLADAAAQVAALRAGTPSNAIIACWQRLETAIAGAGRPAYDWETPTEVTEAVLAEFDVDRDALADLLGLYREARFSRHPLGEPERDRALADLDRLHAGLARHTHLAAPDLPLTPAARDAV